MNIVVCVKQVVDTEAVIALDGAGEVELMGQNHGHRSLQRVRRGARCAAERRELGGTVTLLTLGSQDLPSRPCATGWPWAPMRPCSSRTRAVDGPRRRPGRGPARRGGLRDGRRPRHGRLEVGEYGGGPGHGAHGGRRAAPFLANVAAGLSAGRRHYRRGMRGGRRGVETARLPLPAVVAAQQGLAEPRYPSVRDVMQARRRGAEVRSPWPTSPRRPNRQR